MNPTTIALSVLVLAAVCLADSERRRDRTGCSSMGCAEEKHELSAGEKAWLSERRQDPTDCSSGGCVEEKRELADGEQGLNAPNREHNTARQPTAAPTQAQSPAHDDSHAHDSHQQDSSSPLLKVNFWLTLLISALVAALLS
ncbi:uncharacterized protein LOC119466473 isoform X3 [Dermacentor silvarum]|uniref:uncharacterized protein LOC119466473 isoform X3 n=1 Tax=Dermacentor silvarum TaxID=543639 RepID=UPI0021014935|nr:uncharacterized protein LOC119466473 isoform X3 [Dermacentor silvarum]